MWGKGAGGVLEAKNVINVPASKQLRALSQTAKDHQQPFNLVVSPRTQTIHRDVIEWVKASHEESKIYVYNPKTGSLDPWKDGRY